MMDGVSSLCTSRRGYRVQFSSACEQPLMTDQSIQQGAICYQPTLQNVFGLWLYLSSEMGNAFRILQRLAGSAVHVLKLYKL